MHFGALTSSERPNQHGSSERLPSSSPRVLRGARGGRRCRSVPAADECAGPPRGRCRSAAPRRVEAQSHGRNPEWFAVPCAPRSDPAAPLSSTWNAAGLMMVGGVLIDAGAARPSNVTESGYSPRLHRTEL